MDPDANRGQDPANSDPFSSLVRRIETWRRRILMRSTVEAGGWLMGFTTGFAEGLKAKGSSGEPNLPPPLSSVPPSKVWDTARSNSWRGAWEILTERGADLGVWLCGEGEEKLLARPLDEKDLHSFIYGYEEGLLIGLAIGKHHPWG